MAADKAVWAWCFQAAAAARCKFLRRAAGKTGGCSVEWKALCLGSAFSTPGLGCSLEPSVLDYSRIKRSQCISKWPKVQVWAGKRDLSASWAKKQLRPCPQGSLPVAPFRSGLQLCFNNRQHHRATEMEQGPIQGVPTPPVPSHTTAASVWLHDFKARCTSSFFLINQPMHIK